MFVIFSDKYLTEKKKTFFELFHFTNKSTQLLRIRAIGIARRNSEAKEIATYHNQLSYLKEIKRRGKNKDFYKCYHDQNIELSLQGNMFRVSY